MTTILYIILICSRSVQKSPPPGGMIRSYSWFYGNQMSINRLCMKGPIGCAVILSYSIVKALRVNHITVQ